MTERELYILIVSIVIWMAVSIYATLKAMHYFTVNKKRLFLNILVIWLVPFLWAVFIIALTCKEKNKKGDGYKYHQSGYDDYTKYGS